MHVILKNQPRLKLTDLLRRRKMSLREFIKEAGIQAYGSLLERCAAMGVQAPPESDYLASINVPISTSQQDGVIVLDPPPVIDDFTGRVIDLDAPVVQPDVTVLTKSFVEEPIAVDQAENSQKRHRGRKKQEK